MLLKKKHTNLIICIARATLVKYQFIHILTCVCFPFVYLACDLNCDECTGTRLSDCTKCAYNFGSVIGCASEYKFPSVT